MSVFCQVSPNTFEGTNQKETYLMPEDMPRRECLQHTQQAIALMLHPPSEFWRNLAKGTILQCFSCLQLSISRKRLQKYEEYLNQREKKLNYFAVCANMCNFAFRNSRTLSVIITASWKSIVANILLGFKPLITLLNPNRSVDRLFNNNCFFQVCLYHLSCRASKREGRKSQVTCHMRMFLVIERVI